MRILFFIFVLSTTRVHAQGRNPEIIKNPIAYLVKNILLLGRDTGSIVLIPMGTNNIKHVDPNKQVGFWGILEKYFPGVSMDSLSKIVEAAPCINQKLSVKKIKIYFPVIKQNETPDLEFLYKRFHYVPVFSISNPVYSKDRSVCIIYVGGYQEGPFTVEIKKDINGNWGSHIVTTDWLL